MMRNHLARLFAFVGLVSLMVSSGYAANEITNLTTTNVYNTITDAVNAASDGDTLDITSATLIVEEVMMAGTPDNLTIANSAGATWNSPTLGALGLGGIGGECIIIAGGVTALTLDGVIMAPGATGTADGIFMGAPATLTLQNGTSIDGFPGYGVNVVGGIATIGGANFAGGAATVNMTAGSSLDGNAQGIVMQMDGSVQFGAFGGIADTGYLVVNMDASTINGSTSAAGASAGIHIITSDGPNAITMANGSQINGGARRAIDIDGNTNGGNTIIATDSSISNNANQALALFGGPALNTVSLTNCAVDNNAMVVNARLTVNQVDIDMVNTTMSSAIGTNGIWLHPDVAGTADINLDGCTISGTSTYGILVQTTPVDITLNDTTISGAAAWGIDQQAGGSITCTGTTAITGNGNNYDCFNGDLVVNMTGTNLSGGGWGLNLGEGNYDITLVDCTIDNSVADAIAHNGSGNFTLNATNCSFDGSSRWGIYSAAGTHNVTLDNCTIDNNTLNSAINLAGGTDNVLSLVNGTSVNNAGVHAIAATGSVNATITISESLVTNAGFNNAGGFALLTNGTGTMDLLVTSSTLSLAPAAAPGHGVSCSDHTGGSLDFIDSVVSVDNAGGGYGINTNYTTPLSLDNTSVSSGWIGIRIDAPGDGDITMTNGSSVTSRQTGISCVGANASVSMTDSSVVNCTENGIALATTTTGDLTMLRSSITGCLQSGVINDGGFVSSGAYSFDLTDSHIDANGNIGLWVLRGATADITAVNTTFDSNTRGMITGMNDPVAITANLTDCSFSGNGSEGWTIWPAQGAGNITLDGCTFNGNGTVDTGASGMGVYNPVANTFVFTDCSFNANAAQGLALGNIANSTTLNGCDISYNLNQGLNINADTLVATDCTFIENVNQGVVAGNCDVTLTDCTFDGNASGAANEQFNPFGSTIAAINGGSFVNNAGGWDIIAQNIGGLNIDGTTFDGSAGAAVMPWAAGLHTQISNATFTGPNQAINARGGADAITTLTNCLLDTDQVAVHFSDGTLGSNGRVALVDCVVNNPVALARFGAADPTWSTDVEFVLDGCTIKPETAGGELANRPILMLQDADTEMNIVVKNTDFITSGAQVFNYQAGPVEDPFTTSTMTASFEGCTFRDLGKAVSANTILLTGANPASSVSFDQCDWVYDANNTAVWAQDDYAGTVDVVDSISNGGFYNWTGVNASVFNADYNYTYGSGAFDPGVTVGSNNVINPAGDPLYTTTVDTEYGYLTLGAASPALGVNSGNGTETYLGAKGGYTPPNAVQHWSIFN